MNSEDENPGWICCKISQSNPASHSTQKFSVPLKQSGLQCSIHIKSIEVTKVMISKVINIIYQYKWQQGVKSKNPHDFLHFWHVDCCWLIVLSIRFSIAITIASCLSFEILLELLASTFVLHSCMIVSLFPNTIFACPVYMHGFMY